jgi:hypothetical protein
LKDTAKAAGFGPARDFCGAAVQFTHGICPDCMRDKALPQLKRFGGQGGGP